MQIREMLHQALRAVVLAASVVPGYLALNLLLVLLMSWMLIRDMLYQALRTVVLVLAAGVLPECLVLLQLEPAQNSLLLLLMHWMLIREMLLSALRTVVLAASVLPGLLAGFFRGSRKVPLE
jgi:hypothetical protein